MQAVAIASHQSIFLHRRAVSYCRRALFERRSLNLLVGKSLRGAGQAAPIRNLSPCTDILLI